ncbi:MAG: carboxypeptidase-like regulatory domain-containing protein [Mangrovibacterium sp.]
MHLTSLILSETREEILLLSYSCHFYYFIFPSRMPQPRLIKPPRSVTGTVKSNTGELLPGVSIVVKGTTQGTITDIDGRYSLTNVPPDAILVFSFVGMKNLEIAVNGQSRIDITLEEETIGLEEIVAVGYGTMKRSSLTGSTAVMDADKIEAFPSINIADAFQGKTAGVYVNPSNEPGGDVTIRVRGNRSLAATNDPLIIIDDV